MKKGINLFSAGGAHGSVAQRLLAGGLNVNSLRTNDVLRKDEWIQYDTAVVKVMRERLRVVSLLQSMGLIYRIGNGLGKTVLQYEAMSDMDPAELSMAGITKGDNDRVEFDIRSLPLPLVHKDFEINIRALHASRETGEALDTTQAEISARKVAELTEDIFVNGYSGFKFAGANLYGLTTYPNRITGNLSGTTGWTSSTGADPKGDVLGMKQALIDAGFYGPYVLFVSTNYETTLDDDYQSGTASAKTVRERLMSIGGLTKIVELDQLADNTCVLVQATSDVIRAVEGLSIRNVQWDTNGGMTSNFKVMQIYVPQIRHDYDGNCGIAHYVPA